MIRIPFIDMHVLGSLIVLLASLQSVRSDIVLTQSDSELKQAGQSLKLRCGISGFDVKNYWMAWLRQTPGKGFECLVYYHNPSYSKFYNPAMQSRLSASKDSSNFYLQMNNLQVSDSAVYFCARVEIAGIRNLDYWGTGTMVTVTSGTPSAPSLFPIHPCCDAITSLSSLEIGCFVTADSPSSRIEWFPDSGSSPISSGVKSYPAVYNNGRYSLSSVLKVSTSDWNSKSYQCKVDQLRKPLKPVEPVCDTISDPKIELYMASCESSDIDSRYLLCIITDFSPDDIEVAWFKGRGTPITNFIKADNSSKGKDGKFSTKSKLLLNKDEWNMGTVYTCTVTHLTSGKRFSKKITACLD